MPLACHPSVSSIRFGRDMGGVPVALRWYRRMKKFSGIIRFGKRIMLDIIYYSIEKVL
jgi:hypothetical protein